MMKKILCMLLCVALLLPVAVQAKTFGYTITQLIGRQLTSGGTSLRVQLTAAADGQAVAGIDAQTWELLKALLPEMKITGSYFMSKSGDTKGDQQAKAGLLKGEESLGALTLTGRGANWYLESDLLPGKVYSITRDLSQAYMHMTTPEAGSWPDIMRLINAVEETDAQFKAQLDRAMNEHMASLNSWLQGYTQVEMTPGTAGVAMQQEIKVPAADMKQQMKDFLAEIYADKELLALLRTVVPDADAKAYLESGMLPLFREVIDGMELTGDVLITRAYDAAGVLTSEVITLPFGSGMPIKLLSVSRGGTLGLRVETVDGAVFAVSATGSMQAGSGVYNGEVTIKQGEKAFEAVYTLAISQGMEQYLEENTSRERDQKHEISLLLRPKDGKSFADQQLTLSVHLMAGASNTKPAYVDAQLLWCDLANGGTLTVNAKLNTNAGLRHSAVDEASSAQVDTADRATREELAADFAAQLKTVAETLLQKLMPVIDD